MKQTEMPADDPRPVPPPENMLNQCCGSGCENCVLDIYNHELRQYHIDLAAWEARQAARQDVA